MRPGCGHAYGIAAIITIIQDGRRLPRLASLPTRRKARMRTSGEVKKYVRFEHPDGISYGLLNGKSVQELAGSIYDGTTPTGRSFARDDVKLLVPCEPTKVIAVGLNYASHRVHVESSEGVIVNAAGRPVPADYPGVFAKFPSSL